MIEVLTDRDGRYRHVGVQRGGYRPAIVEDGQTLLETAPFEVATSAAVRRQLTLR